MSKKSYTSPVLVTNGGVVQETMLVPGSDPNEIPPNRKKQDAASGYYL